MAKAKKSESTEIGNHAVSDQKILAGYKFEVPLLITERALIELADTKCWESGSAWVKYLAGIGGQEKGIGALKGIVIPLELKGSNMVRQDAHGVELLTWLRWSASEPLRCVPVLVTAFQPLESVLRRKLNLLMVARGTQFFRLPDSLERDRLVAFKDAVRGAQSSELWANAYDLDRMAGTASGTPPGVTYHDLANHYYAAHRLWEGYKAAVGYLTGNLKKEELARVEKIENEFSWKKDKDELLSRPDVKQYLALAKQRLGAPGYPIVSSEKQVILRHIEYGLPPRTRILLVDDEFDQGLADVLLAILFKNAKFNFENKNKTELVYSEESEDISDDKKEIDKRYSARMVCVKSADSAIHWLKYWGDIKKSDALDEWDFKINEQEWLSQWVENDGADIDEDYLPEEILRRIDQHVSNKNMEAYKGVKHKRNKNNKIKPNEQEIIPKRNNRTVVLLDLRLKADEQEGTYAPQQLASVKLRAQIKANRNQPASVVMLTASRQTMNYAMVMEDASKADGWLMKEGPDIDPDPKNSAQSVHYLLGRLHREEVDWYRHDMQWKDLWYLYYDFRNATSWRDEQAKIEGAAKKCFDEAKTKIDCNDYQYQNLDGWTQSFFSNFSNIESILARRLFYFGMLFDTAKINTSGCFESVVFEFNKMIPGIQLKSKNNKDRQGAKYPSEVYNSAPLGASYRALDKKLLLKKEYEWLRDQVAGDNDKKDYLQEIISEIAKSESKL